MSSFQYELYLRVRGRIHHHRAVLVDYCWEKLLEDNAEGKTGGGECGTCDDG